MRPIFPLAKTHQQAIILTLIGSFALRADKYRVLALNNVAA